MLQKKKNAVTQAKTETLSKVAGKALRIEGGFPGALTEVQLSFAGACPALRNTSAIFGD
jgi:hypothetical protein